MEIDRNEIAETNDEIEAAFSAAGVSLTVEDLCFGPRSEIDDFRRDRSGWARPGSIHHDSPGALVILGAAALKGQRRRTVAVVRLTGGCAIYGMEGR